MEIESRRNYSFTPGKVAIIKKIKGGKMWGKEIADTLLVGMKISPVTVKDCLAFPQETRSSTTT